MTEPYRFSKGSLGTFAGLAPGASHEFQDIRPDSGAHELAIYLRASQKGTVRIDRIDDDPAAPTTKQRTIKDTQIPTPNDPDDDEIELLIPSPAGTYRVTFTADPELLTNTTGSARGSWNGGHSLGWPYPEN